MRSPSMRWLFTIVGSTTVALIASSASRTEDAAESAESQLRSSAAALASGLPEAVRAGSHVLHLEKTLENGVSVGASLLLEPPVVTLSDRQLIAAGSVCRPVSASYVVQKDEDMYLARSHELEMCALDSSHRISQTFTVFPELGEVTNPPGWDLSLAIEPRKGLTWGSITTEQDVELVVSGKPRVTTPMQNPRPLKDEEPR